MNFNTLKQELNKKIKLMSEKDFNNFIIELKRVYYKTHRMTVKQLIKKLSKYPQDAEVLIPNSEMYVDGIYHVTNIEEYDGGAILIDTDYKAESEG